MTISCQNIKLESDKTSRSYYQFTENTEDKGTPKVYHEYAMTKSRSWQKTTGQTTYSLKFKKKLLGKQREKNTEDLKDIPSKFSIASYKTIEKKSYNVHESVGNVTKNWILYDIKKSLFLNYDNGIESFFFKSISFRDID